MARRASDSCVFVTLGKEEIADLRELARKKKLSIAALMRIATNHYLQAIRAEVALVEIRHRGRPHK